MTVRGEVNERRSKAVAWLRVSAAVAAIGSWNGVLLVLGGWLVPGWALAGGCLTAGIGLQVRARMTGGIGPSSPTKSWHWMAGRCCGWLAVAGVTLGVLNHVIYGVAQVELHPSTGTGCRLIAVESSFLFAGSGQIYLATSSWGLGQKVATYVGDDGARPFSAGDYELSWSDGYPALTLIQDGVDPVWIAGSGTAAC